MTARGGTENVAEQPFLRSTLALRPGSWRQFVRETVALVWCTSAVVGSWWGWWQLRPSRAFLVIAVLTSAWCAYAARSWAVSLVRRRRTLDSGAPTLQLDGRGVWVRHPFGPSGGAFLHWVDCVAVVVSPTPTGGRTSESYRGYVQFVPASPGLVEGAPHPRDQRTELLERPATEVLTAWMELTGVGHSTAEVAAWLRRWRPDLRVLDSWNRQPSV